jgi:hypothetical protein
LAQAGGAAPTAPQAAVEMMPTTPVDDAVAVEGEPAAADEGAGRLTLVLVLVATVFVVLGSALLVVLLFASDVVRTRWEPVDYEHDVAEQRAEAHWTDAVNKTIKIDNVRVRIDRAEWGHVRGRDSHGHIILSDDPYLSIIVNVRNRSRRTVPYQSWHSGPYPAVLMDETNREYGRFSVSRFKAIEWHVPDEQLEPAQEIDDRLTFAIPEDVPHDSIAAFRLELPAEALSLEGTFRFRIPVEMVEGF